MSLFLAAALLLSFWLTIYFVLRVQHNPVHWIVVALGLCTSSLSVALLLSVAPSLSANGLLVACVFILEPLFLLSSINAAWALGRPGGSLLPLRRLTLFATYLPSLLLLFLGVTQLLTASPAFHPTRMAYLVAAGACLEAALLFFLSPLAQIKSYLRFAIPGLTLFGVMPVMVFLPPLPFWFALLAVGFMAAALALYLSRQQVKTSWSPPFFNATSFAFTALWCLAYVITSWLVFSTLMPAQWLGRPALLAL